LRKRGVSERRQFRLLVRASIGRLMETAVASRDTDAAQFVIWAFALVITPPFLYAGKMFGKYHMLARKPDVLERVVLVDRLFFIIYAMLACALLAALLWDALFPDRQDQEIVGVLPVRPRTLAFARIITALCVATVYSVGMSMFCGIIYTLNVAGAFRVAHIVGWWPAAFFAHVTTMSMAGMFTFAALLTARGIAVACVGAERAQRAAAILQLVTVVLLVEVFVFLPTVLFSLAGELTEPLHASRFPPLWFLGLYTAIAGPATSHVPGLASFAFQATLGAIGLAIASYILPATWTARRTLEARLTNHAGRSIAMMQRITSPIQRAAATRAIFGFVLASLLRSRRHALIVATHLGAAVAVAGIRLMAATVRGKPLAFDAPADYLLSIPLVLTFLLVVGLRAAFKVPTDVDANWVFRTSRPRTTTSWLQAVAVALVLLAVLPVTAAWLLVALSLWDVSAALSSAAMHVASGVMLVELMLLGVDSVPFTRASVPASSGVRAGWAMLLVELHLYAFRLDDLQLLALKWNGGVTIYIVATLLVALAARKYRTTRPGASLLDFDPPADAAVERLNLSQALG
jgi:hypothetical protein